MYELVRFGSSSPFFFSIARVTYYYYMYVKIRSWMCGEFEAQWERGVEYGDV